MSFSIAHSDIIESFEALLLDGLELEISTRGFVLNLCLGIPTTVEQSIDFSVTSPEHYHAWVDVVFTADTLEGIRQRVLEIDQALGCGKSMTILIEKYAPKYTHLTFESFKDWIAEEKQDIESW